jgi:hypothetical protein
MARRTVVTVSGVGASTLITPDIHLTPFNIGLFVAVTGTINYTVQATGDDITAPGFTPGGATWYPHTTLASLAANAASNYAFPVTAIQLITNSGTGTATLTAIQAGVHN